MFYKKIQIFFLIAFSICLYDCHALDNFRSIYPDFDLSMARYGRSQPLYQRYYVHIDFSAPPLYYENKSIIKLLYDLDKHRSFSNDGNYKIPRIIHQIWLGGPLPAKYKEWVATWKNWNGWQYMLWTDEDVKQLDLYNSDLYRRAPNYGEKADILRYEILYNFGGLYVDTDMECVSSDFFEFAHQEYSFFAGIEPLECCHFSLGNAILASAPGHPIMEKIVTGLAENAPLYQWTVEKTGPRYVTKVVCENWQLIEQDGLVFPPTFFYPILGHEKNLIRLICKHECAAIHFWDGSWVK